jgi:hypothetical protein
VIQSNVPPDAFTHFVEILDGAEPHFSQEAVDDLMVLAQEFGHNSLIASLAPQRDLPRHKDNGHELLQEFDRDVRSTTIEANIQSIRNLVGFIQRHTWVIKEAFGEKLARIMSELEKMAGLVKQLSKKHSSGQRAWFQTPIVTSLCQCAIHRGLIPSVSRM